MCAKCVLDLRHSPSARCRCTCVHSGSAVKSPASPTCFRSMKHCPMTYNLMRQDHHSENCRQLQISWQAMTVAATPTNCLWQDVIGHSALHTWPSSEHCLHYHCWPWPWPSACRGKNGQQEKETCVFKFTSYSQASPTTFLLVFRPSMRSKSPPLWTICTWLEATLWLARWKIVVVGCHEHVHINWQAPTATIHDPTCWILANKPQCDQILVVGPATLADYRQFSHLISLGCRSSGSVS